MASAVIQPVSPDWLLFFERFPVFLPDPFPVPASLHGAFSPARYARMHAQYRVSIWAGYEIFKVRRKGKFLNCNDWIFFRNVTPSLIADWKGQKVSSFKNFFRISLIFLENGNIA